MVEDVGICRHETLGRFLNVQNAGDDSLLKVVDLLAGRVVDHGVDIALALEFHGRQTHLLGALLPRQVQAPSDACQTLGLNGAENAVAHRQDEIAGCQRNSTAGIAKAVDDAQVGNIGIGHFGDEPRDAVRLVVLVRHFVASRTGRIHQADDRQGSVGELFDACCRFQVVFRLPLAAANGAVLGDEGHAPFAAVEIHRHDGGVEGPIGVFFLHAAETPDHRRRWYALGIVGAGHHRFDVGIDIQMIQFFRLAANVLVRQDAAQRRIEGAFVVG